MRPPFPLSPPLFNYQISFCHVHPTGALLLEQNEGGDLEAGPHELAFSHESSATGMMSAAQHEDAQFGQIGAEEDMWTGGDREAETCLTTHMLMLRPLKLGEEGLSC
jgi:hypothetical protein